MSNLKILEKVNSIILEKLKCGAVPWRRQWKQSQSLLAQNGITKKAYRGINFFILNMLLAPQQSPYFLTFKQAKAMGGSVRKGQKGLPVFFWKMIETKPKEGEEAEIVPMLKQYTVFNLEQIDLPSERLEQFKIEKEEVTPLSPDKEERRKNKIFNQFLENIPSKPKVVIGTNYACYKPATDEICIPKRNRFVSFDEYVKTFSHELGHATGHKDRLNREGVTKNNKFGSEIYSKEELIAEMTSAYVGTHLNMNFDYDNSTSYISGWSKKIQDDPYFFITACSKAQKAFDYLTNQVTSEEG